jgi:hypothetical protein
VTYSDARFTVTHLFEQAHRKAAAMKQSRQQYEGLAGEIASLIGDNAALFTEIDAQAQAEADAGTPGLWSGLKAEKDQMLADMQARQAEIPAILDAMRDRIAALGG